MLRDDFALLDAVKYGCMNDVVEAIERGADVNAISEHDKTPLEIAQAQGEIDIARWLIKNGATITQEMVNRAARQEDFGFTVLYMSHGWKPEPRAIEALRKKSPNGYLMKEIER